MTVFDAGSTPVAPTMKIEEVEYQNDFIDFVADLQDRLGKGASEYDNKSFSKDPLTLVQEIQEELLDVANWSFILFKRLRIIEKALRDV